MKHAYLIIAHNEFYHLQQLIDALDDERNDIYVHIDRKVKQLPDLIASKSRLIIIPNRIDVRWGSISQIRSEYALFEAASAHNTYAYYHLISGTHFPVKTQDEIHQWFNNQNGESLLSPLADFTDTEIEFKLRYYHFFLRWIKSDNQIMRKVGNLSWRLSLRLQRDIVRRNYKYFHEKCPNWVSLTHEAVMALIAAKKKVLKQMKYTFCCDEIFVPSVLHETGIKYRKDERLIFADFRMASPITLKEEDFERLIKSDCIFARKFTSESQSLINKIKQQCLHPESQL